MSYNKQYKVLWSQIAFVLYVEYFVKIKKGPVPMLSLLMKVSTYNARNYKACLNVKEKIYLNWMTDFPLNYKRILLLMSIQNSYISIKKIRLNLSGMHCLGPGQVFSHCHSQKVYHPNKLCGDNFWQLFACEQQSMLSKIHSFAFQIDPKLFHNIKLKDKFIIQFVLWELVYWLILRKKSYLNIEIITITQKHYKLAM